jgi:hypothetical protein
MYCMSGATELKTRQISVEASDKTFRTDSSSRRKKCKFFHFFEIKIGFLRKQFKT